MYLNDILAKLKAEGFEKLTIQGLAPRLNALKIKRKKDKTTQSRYIIWDEGFFRKLAVRYGKEFPPASQERPILGQQTSKPPEASKTMEGEGALSERLLPSKLPSLPSPLKGVEDIGEKSLFCESELNNKRLKNNNSQADIDINNKINNILNEESLDSGSHLVHNNTDSPLPEKLGSLEGRAATDYYYSPSKPQNELGSSNWKIPCDKRSGMELPLNKIHLCSLLRHRKYWWPDT